MSNQKTLPKTPERITVRRKRFQIGCLRKMKRGRQWIWIGKYYENGEGRTRVLGNCVKMTEGGARAKLQEILHPINQGAGFRPGLPTNFRDYVLKVFLPQRRKKWKASTDITTTERFKIYLLTSLGDYQMTELTRDRLQLFLDEKVSSGLSTSVVDHLRWDLNAIFKMASDDAILQICRDYLGSGICTGRVAEGSRFSGGVYRFRVSFQRRSRSQTLSRARRHSLEQNRCNGDLQLRVNLS
jgi:hypothetical protein